MTKKQQRLLVYQKCGGKCAYCGQDITINKMQVDHYYPKYLGGIDHIDNMLPTCRQCNHYKRGTPPDLWKRHMLTLHERITKIYIHKVAINFGIATIKPFDGQFYFERIGIQMKPITELIKQAS